MRVSLENAAAFAIARHGIRTGGDGLSDGPEAAQRTLGLHAQLLNSAAMSVAARVKAYDRDRFRHELYQDHTLVKVWCMRGTLHLVAAGDYPLFLSAIMRRRGLRYREFLSRCDFTPEEIEGLPARAARALAGGPLTRAELHEQVPELRRIPFPEWGQDVKDLCYLGKLVHAEPAGAEARFALADRWVAPAGDSAKLLPIPEEEALAELLARYLKSYAPAAVSDFAYWAGLESVATATEARGRLGDRVAEVDVVGYRNPLLAMTEDLDELASSAPNPGLFALPRFDPLLLGHRDRRRFVDDEWRSRLVHPGGFVAATVWSSGRIIATWDYKVSRGALLVRASPFRALTPQEERSLVQATEPFAAALGLSGVKLAR